MTGSFNERGGMCSNRKAFVFMISIVGIAVAATLAASQSPKREQGSGPNAPHATDMINALRR